MSFLSVLGSGREAVSLLTELKALLDIDRAKDKSFRECLIDLRREAVGLAEKLSKRLDHILRRLQDLGVNLDSSEQDAASQFRRTCNLIRRLQFNRLTEELDNLRSDFRRFVSDVEALYLCSGESHTIGETPYTAHNVRKELYDLSLANAPLRKHLEIMINTVEGIIKNLQ